MNTGYEEWLNNFISTDKKRNHALSEIEIFSYRPLISIATPVYNIEEIWLEKCIRSILKQTYQNWELCIVDDASTRRGLKRLLQRYANMDPRIKLKFLLQNLHISGATNEAITMADGEFIAFLDHDDELHENALYEVANLLQSTRDADIIYTDNDIIDTTGKRFNPKFKPDWSPELLLSYMYISHLLICRTDLVRRMGSFRIGYEGSQDHDLVLRLSEITNKIYHIPKILYHARSLPQSVASSGGAKPYSFISGIKAVQDAVDRRGIRATVEMPDFATKGNMGIYKLNFKISHKDKVAIIIPTRDRVDLLKNCIGSIEAKTTYPNYEIIIANNNSQEEETLKYLYTSKHKVVNEDTGELFNFSRIVNQTLRQLDDDIEYILLLNNDTEVIAENWIEEMLGFMQCPEIGAVGAKLLYKNNTIQHAGVILGLREDFPGHGFKSLSNSETGYLAYPQVVRNYAAVTAACMLTRRSCYNEVGGFDEVSFHESYNDVDYSLKLLKHGYRVVYTPYAVLYHYESSSRGPKRVPAENEYHFMKKWGDINPDPYYNPNLLGGLFKINNKIKEVLTINRTIKILFITNNLECEGAPLSLLSIAKGLNKDKYKVFVFSTRDGILKESYQKEGIEVLIKNIKVTNVNISDFDSDVKSVVDLIRTHVHVIDLIFCNTLNTFYGLYLAYITGIPSIWCIRESVDINDYFKNYCGNSMLTRLAIECLQVPTHLIFAARATAELFGDLDKNSQFRVIYNGIEIEDVEKYKITHSKTQLRKEYGIPNNTKVITIVGTTTCRKGQHIFIQAAIEMLKKNNNLIFFIIGGRKEEVEYLGMLERMIKEAGVGEYIKIIPETPNVFPFYRISDIFTCTSYEESFPRVILEAMAFQLPIVSTNVFGIKEQIKDNVSGLLVHPGDYKLLSEKIELLLSDEIYANELAQNAYYRVLTSFTYKKMIRAYERCFNESIFSPLNNYEFKTLRGKVSVLIEEYSSATKRYVKAVERSGFIEANKTVIRKLYRKLIDP